MRTKISIVFLAAASVGGLLSSCYVAQPAFECQPAASGYWASYTLVSGTGACSTYTGDVIRVQRYLPPGTKDGTIAVLARRVGRLTRALSPETDELYRYDLTDPNYTKESARGPLTTIEANSDGVCKATLQPTDQTLPEAQFPNPVDGGTIIVPEVHVKYEYSNLRFINTARFPGTVLASTLDVTLDTCTAKYEVLAIWPPIQCTEDADCDPSADLDAGRSVGSGLSPDYKPVCGPVEAGKSFCVATVPFEELTKLK